MRVRATELLALGLVLLGAHGAAAMGRQVPPSLVFERSGDLYRMTVDGSETVRLTTTRAVERSPAVSPERLRIAYARGDELWVMDTNGRTRSRVLGARPKSVRGATTDSPAWAASGNRIYVSRSALGPNGICGWIYGVDLDGAALRTLTRGVELHARPAASADGRRIAYIAGACEPTLDCCQVRVVDVAGRATTDLRKLPGRFRYEDVTWSPDGGQVAVEAQFDDEARAVYVADRDGSALRRVTPRGLNAEGPAWSPDGDSIAFAAWTRSRSYDLYVIHADGTGLRRLTTTTAKEHSPAWLLRT